MTNTATYTCQIDPDSLGEITPAETAHYLACIQAVADALGVPVVFELGDAFAETVNSRELSDERNEDAEWVTELVWHHTSWADQSVEATVAEALKVHAGRKAAASPVEDVRFEGSVGVYKVFVRQDGAYVYERTISTEGSATSDAAKRAALDAARDLEQYRDDCESR